MRSRQDGANNRKHTSSALITNIMLKKLFTELIDVRKGERGKALAMSLFFFLAMATFWALKPMKRGLFISYHKENALELLGAHFGGAQAEQLAKVVNVFAALLFAMAFSYITRRVAPRYIIPLFCLLFTLAFIGYAGVVSNPGIWTVWSFYVFGDMYNTLMLTLFWTLMNNSVEVNSAKRLYGIVGLGGVTGGLVGATLVRSSVTMFGREMVLLSCILPTIVIAVIGFMFARRMENKQVNSAHRVNSSDERHDVASRFRASGGSALSGLRLLASSKYLLAICLLVAFYEIASSIIDFQLSAMVERNITGGLARDQYFGFVAQVQGAASILVQLFLTSFVMRRFGVGHALLALPVVILLGSVGFLLVPTLGFVTLMSVSDNSMNYSINQSAKETLYVPTTAEEKYQAKAFIDMFVQRSAKVVAVGLNLGLVAFVSIEQVRWLSVASILTLALWIGVIRFAGRRFDRLAGTRVANVGEATPTRSYEPTTHGATNRPRTKRATTSPLHASYCKQRAA
ncbi:MAG TPA: Npt1/Npt2 family nucleotide transporter [Pyrinomonadaceae bacterium]|nr:Npt1/Npt2 family nucleotide transporter [Pyrinomonadaceae bacterium]